MAEAVAEAEAAEDKVTAAVAEAERTGGLGRPGPCLTKPCHCLADMRRFS